MIRAISAAASAIFAGSLSTPFSGPKAGESDSKSRCDKGNAATSACFSGDRTIEGGTEKKKLSHQSILLVLSRGPNLQIYPASTAFFAYEDLVERYSLDAKTNGILNFTCHQKHASQHFLHHIRTKSPGRNDLLTYKRHRASSA